MVTLYNIDTFAKAPIDTKSYISTESRRHCRPAARACSGHVVDIDEVCVARLLGSERHSRESHLNRLPRRHPGGHLIRSLRPMSDKKNVHCTGGYLVEDNLLLTLQ